MYKRGEQTSAGAELGSAPNHVRDAWHLRADMSSSGRASLGGAAAQAPTAGDGETLRSRPSETTRREQVVRLLAEHGLMTAERRRFFALRRTLESLEGMSYPVGLRRNTATRSWRPRLTRWTLGDLYRAMLCARASQGHSSRALERRGFWRGTCSWQRFPSAEPARMVPARSLVQQPG